MMMSARPILTPTSPPPPPPPIAFYHCGHLSPELPKASFERRTGGFGVSGSYWTMTAAAAMTTAAPPVDDGLTVVVPRHPLIKHWMSILRNEQTPCGVFKSAMSELGRLLMYEATMDWLPTISGDVQTPMGAAAVEFVDPQEPVVVVPILRAGLALIEHASSFLPATRTYHLGMCRDETTLQPSVYLNKLPDKFPEGARILLADPMLATGGTISTAIDMLKDCGADDHQIKIISAVASPLALDKLGEKYPRLRVYAGAVDPVVNERGFIVPGLGDAGDRSFGT